MKSQIPEILLVLYILLPIKSVLVAQVLLCQVRAIQLLQQAESKLAQETDEETEQGLRDLLRYLV